MKKLLVAVAIVCAAVFTQAATYDWKSNGAVYWESSESFEEFDGYTIYAFDANAFSKESVVGLLGSGDISALDNALGYGTVDAYEFSFTGTGLSSVERPDPNDNNKVQNLAEAYLVLLSTKQADGKQYFATYDTASVEITDAVKTGGAKLTTGDGWILENLPAEGATGWTALAPEPTSGLLLLLGMAGLALKRKRA